jgi:selenocysteine-specific elongation factor
VFARLTLCEGAPTSLQRGGAVRFHQGTCERAARYRTLSQDGDAWRIELFLREPAVLAPGDRFVLRRPAPVDTVGGGVITDAHPPHKRRATAADFDLDALDPAAAVARRLERAGVAGVEAGELATALGLTAERLNDLLAPLEREERALRSGGRWVDAAAWRETQKDTLQALADWHATEPLRMGIARETLRSRVAADLPQESWRRLLAELQDGGELTLRGEQVARAGHQVTLGEREQELARRVESSFRTAGLVPPAWESLAEPSERDWLREIVELLVARGTLARIHDGKLFHAEALGELIDRLRDYARTSPTIDVAAFKELTGVTRKHAIPLLEHLDALRVTRRVGNHREILEP